MHHEMEKSRSLRLNNSPTKLHEVTFLGEKTQMQNQFIQMSEVVPY